MPRVKVRGLVLSISSFAILLVWYQYYYSYFQEEDVRRLAIKNILNVVGSRNSSAATLVLPDEETMVVQPSWNLCEEDGKDIYALFMVNSSPENKERRDVIRKGWGSTINTQEEKANRYNKYIFFTGSTLHNDVQNRVLEEWAENRDMVVDDMHDTYLNLTLKILRMFKWKQKYCSRSILLIKIDDDVHLNVQKFLNHLRKYSDFDAHNMVAGHLYNNSSAIRDPYSKWYVPTEFWPEETFPNFVSGICYALGDEVVPKIYQASLGLPLFHLEDVFLTGMIASHKLKMKLTPLPDMLTFWSPFSNLVTSSCHFQKFTCVHSVSSQMLRCWTDFNKKDFKCSSWPLFTYC